MLAISRTVFLLFFATFAVAAPIPKELKTKPDAERILGVWDMPVSRVGTTDRATAQWTFIEGKMLSRSNPEAGATEWVIKLDPEKSPKHIDIGTYAGIYEFDGEVLKIAYKLGSNRPTDFTPENDKYYCELKYVGEAPKK